MKQYLNEKYPNAPICYDGVINQTLYDSQNIKVVCLLKEVNLGSNNQSFDISEALENEFAQRYVMKNEKFNPIHNSYLQLTRYLALLAFHSNDEDLPFSRVQGPKVREYDFAKYYRSSALVNVKKVGGSSKTNLCELNKFAYSDREILKNQINNLKPNVILCGGTFDQYEIIYQTKLKKIGDVIFKDIHNDRIVLKLSHPGSRKKKCYEYNILKLSLENLKKT